MDFLDDIDYDNDTELLQLVEKIEKENSQLIEKNAKDLTEKGQEPIQHEMNVQWNNFQQFRNMPAMFFPNSNITINYNFSSN